MPSLVPFDPDTDPRRVPSAEDRHTAIAEQQRTLALLHHLGDDQREAVTLRIVAELSLEETAQVMDRSVGAVKQLQRRALESLRTLVSKGSDHD
jgi:RNA polymerase sigma-70 factor (ECF subfamily)